MSEAPNPDQSGGRDDDWGDTLEDAFKKAWGKKPKKDTEQVFGVDKIHVKGSNPISGYRVTLGD
jgi:hypothetical protein